MSRALTPQDCHVLMNLLVKEATAGNTTIQQVNSSNFVSAGEQVLATGTDNTINTLSLIIGRTLVAVRPYNAKLSIINALNSGAYSNRIRKISYYNKEAEAAGDWNTQLYADNLKDGTDNTATATSVGTMWQKSLPVALEMNFGGSSVWDVSQTILEYQLKEAFTDEASFGSFVGGIMTELANTIEQEREAFNRLALLNKIAGTYDLSASMPGSVIDLTAAYNARYGTSYSGAQLRTQYLKSFLEFFVETFKLTSDRMTERTSKYHWTPIKAGHTLLRHTPKTLQRAVLYSPFFTQATAEVLPEIFSPEYLGDITQNGELVTYWQNANDDESAKIDIVPAIPDVTGAGGQVAGDRVQLNYVLGILYDVDGIMTDMQLDSAYSTGVEARHAYRNLWYHFKKNVINDFTENTVIFIMS